MGHNSGHVSASASSQSFQGVGAGGRLALQVGSNTPGPVPPSQSYAAVVSGAKSVKQLEHHNQHQLIQNIQRPSSQLKDRVNAQQYQAAGNKKYVAVGNSGGGYYPNVQDSQQYKGYTSNHSGSASSKS